MAFQAEACEGPLQSDCRRVQIPVSKKSWSQIDTCLSEPLDTLRDSNLLASDDLQPSSVLAPAFSDLTGDFGEFAFNTPSHDASTT